VVIGGGLLGLEAANGLMKRGMEVTVVHAGERLLDRQLDETAAALLQASLAERGMRFLMQAQTRALTGDGQGRVAQVHLQDGRSAPASLVVMAVGIRPETTLAEQMRLHVQRGIVVSDTLQTVAYGLVEPLFEQSKVLANHLAEMGIGRYPGSQTSAKLKVTGIHLFSAGDFRGDEGTEEIVLSDPGAGVYRKLVLRGDRLVGACLYGDTEDGGWYFRLLREGVAVQGLRDRLLFGEDHAGHADPASSA
jgi:nitrite reductase (NADH) large subunit